MAVLDMYTIFERRKYRFFSQHLKSFKDDSQVSELINDRGRRQDSKRIGEDERKRAKSFLVLVGISEPVFTVITRNFKGNEMCKKFTHI